MKILPITLKNNFINNNLVQQKKSNDNFCCSYAYNPVINYPKSFYLLSFGAKVPKDLNSFYERNLDRLPYSVKAHIENLSQEAKENTTPLQAQYDAFSYVDICENVDELKEIYPNEPLFMDLKNSSDVKASVGILYEINSMKDALNECNEQVFPGSNDDLSIYLLKKIFLYGKSLTQINQDIDNEINPVFKKDDKNYINYSTFRALGIKLPPHEYLTSIRYTQEGYSDSFNRKKPVKKFTELSKQEKDAIIDSHTSKTDSSRSRRKVINQSSSTSARTYSEQEKQDASKRAKKRWSEMTPEQKAVQLDAMRLGGERSRIAFIDAWNHLPNERLKLAKFLVKNSCASPDSIIYSSSSYTPAMSVIMENFWIENEGIADLVSKESKNAFFRYEAYSKKGKLDQYIQNVLDDQEKSKNEIKKLVEEYKLEFENIPQIERYRKFFSFLPDDLLDKQCELLNEYSEDEIAIWIDYLRGKKIDKKYEEIINKIDSRINFTDLAVETQTYIISAIKVFDDSLAPIVNPKTGQTFKPFFPSSQRFYFSDVCNLYFKFKKDGYKNVRLNKDFENDIINASILSQRYMVEFDNKLLKSCKYAFSKEPDFEKIKDIYKQSSGLKITEQQAMDAVNRVFGIDFPEKLRKSYAEVFLCQPYLYYDILGCDTSLGVKYRELIPMQQRAMYDIDNSSFTIPEMRNCIMAYGIKFANFFVTNK